MLQGTSGMRAAPSPRPSRTMRTFELADDGGNRALGVRDELDLGSIAVDAGDDPDDALVVEAGVGETQHVLADGHAAVLAPVDGQLVLALA